MDAAQHRVVGSAPPCDSGGVASERRTCPKPRGCGRKFSRPLGSRRVFCETCRPPRKRSGPSDPGGKPDTPDPASLPAATLELAAFAELQLAGRVDTFEGALWLRLAREADQAPGSSVARLIPGLLKAKDTALAGWKRPTRDRVDQLAEARARKAAQA